MQNYRYVNNKDKISRQVELMSTGMSRVEVLGKALRTSIRRIIYSVSNPQVFMRIRIQEPKNVHMDPDLDP